MNSVLNMNFETFLNLAPQMNHAINQNFVGGWDHNGQFVQMSGELTYPGYGFYNNENQNGYGAFGGMYNHGGTYRTFHRSASMPVDNRNGGYYTGEHSSSPAPTYWTDGSSGSNIPSHSYLSLRLIFRFYLTLFVQSNFMSPSSVYESNQIFVSY